MIDDLDESLRKLLIREIPIKNGEVDISFTQPRREWSSRLSRPTLNLFMHKLQENQKLRNAQPTWNAVRNPDGTVSQQRKPVRVDLHYMITAWATEAEDEHRLLSRVLLALFRYPNMPDDVLVGHLKEQPRPITMMVAKVNELEDTSLMWSALDNEMRPVVSCILTLSINPYRVLTSPLVRTRDLGFGQARRPASMQFDQPDEVEHFWTIGGIVRSEQPVADMRLVLVEQDKQVSIGPDGRFAVGHLREGEYTLQVFVDGGEPRRFKITVPSADYELNV